MRKVFLLTVTVVAIGASPAISTQVSGSLSTEPEAPVAIAVTTQGHWLLSGDAGAARAPVLRYQDRSFPSLSLDLITFRCERRQVRTELIGLLPAQRFPQPVLTMRIGPSSWSTTPDALYSARSQPHIDQQVRLEKNSPLSWPGHPPYAVLTFYNWRSLGLNIALGTGAPLEIEFNGQRRTFPVIPPDIAARFARACEAVAAPRTPGTPG